jgi:hypothetical protein
LIVYRTEDGRFLIVFNAHRLNPPSVELAPEDAAWLAAVLGGNADATPSGHP